MFNSFDGVSQNCEDVVDVAFGGHEPCADQSGIGNCMSDFGQGIRTRRLESCAVLKGSICLGTIGVQSPLIYSRFIIQLSAALMTLGTRRHANGYVLDTACLLPDAALSTSFLGLGLGRQAHSSICTFQHQVRRPNSSSHEFCHLQLHVTESGTICPPYHHVYLPRILDGFDMRGRSSLIMGRQSEHFRRRALKTYSKKPQSRRSLGAAIYRDLTAGNDSRVSSGDESSIRGTPRITGHRTPSAS